MAEGRFRRNFACLEIAGSFLLFGGYSVGLHNDVLRFDFGMNIKRNRKEKGDQTRKETEKEHKTEE